MRLHATEPAAGHAKAALHVSERARARSLLDTLSEARATIREGVDRNLLEREQNLKRQVNLAAAKLNALLTGPHSVAERQTREREIDELIGRQRQIEVDIRTKSPRYAALVQPSPLRLEEIQRLAVDSSSLLLEYALGTERSYLWAIRPTSFTSHVLPKRIEIETISRRLYDLLTARNRQLPGETMERRAARVKHADAEYWKVAQDLSQMLLGPVAAELGTKRLVIVGDGALQYIPFNALPAPRSIGSTHPLIVDHEIVTLPSASVLHVLRRELADRSPAPKTVAVLADPVFSRDDPRFRRNRPKSTAQTGPRPASLVESRSSSDVQLSAVESGVLSFERLRFSRQEADAVTALAPANGSLKATDFAASRETATSPALGEYRMVHFASHALLNSRHPELSGIVLSLVGLDGTPQDGFLRLHDIYNMRLGADLVVLSACQTALGRDIRGEGLIGLTRGFMYAGAPRILASLWNVDDRATAQLMRQLYVTVLKERQPPAAALRAAQVAMSRVSRWQSPYYWAAFVMQGEWR
jgi:CHAT domain-containing protein